MVGECCASFADGGPALTRHWDNASYSLIIIRSETTV